MLKAELWNEPSIYLCHNEQSKESCEHGEEHIFLYVPFFVMPKLMREYRFNFIFGKALNKRIAQNYSFGLPHSRKSSVSLLCGFTHVKRKYTAYLELSTVA